MYLSKLIRVVLFLVLSMISTLLGFLFIFCRSMVVIRFRVFKSFTPYLNTKVKGHPTRDNHYSILFSLQSCCSQHFWSFPLVWDFSHGIDTVVFAPIGKWNHRFPPYLCLGFLLVQDLRVLWGSLTIDNYLFGCFTRCVQARQQWLQG